MRQWNTLFQKEVLEKARNFKWIWVPATFILLGVMDPLSTYYMPQIIDSLGGLPEGTVIDIPKPSAAEVMLMSMEQFNTLGILIVVLTSAGIIAGERKSGVAELILVKPVSYASYITAKWAASLVLLLLSLLLSSLSSWYYTGVLFENIPAENFFSSLAVIAVWFCFILKITVFFSGLFKQPGAAGVTSIATIVILTIISGSLPHLMEWSPGLLNNYAGKLLVSGELPDHTLASAMAVTGGTVLLLGLCAAVLRKKELAG
ncbi:ABC transporter permease [Bacillus sp. T33-2]|uniref:ABC transporter permease n=1 Tax=Bacillus sp. T33-2 TaxID=2054168 RepID=UPI000C767866|nr:ABC transporter permease subunit [Bacillus sp. T33-2]PLR98847.1 ABC transporter permease [Bacillus sp. T33-2]